MIGIIIITHGNLGQEFIKAAEHVMGEQPSLKALGIFPDDAIEKKRLELLKAIKSVDQGKGVAVLTDMFGGTPSNIAISLLGDASIEVVAGVNLPLLIKLLNTRKNAALGEAIQEAQHAGRRYMNVASQLLSEAS